MASSTVASTPAPRHLPCSRFRQQETSVILETNLQGSESLQNIVFSISEPPAAKRLTAGQRCSAVDVTSTRSDSIMSLRSSSTAGASIAAAPALRFAQIDLRLAMWNRATSGAGAGRRDTYPPAVSSPARSQSSPAVQLAEAAASASLDASAACAHPSRDPSSAGASTPQVELSRSRSAHVYNSSGASSALPRGQTKSLGNSSAFNLINSSSPRSVNSDRLNASARSSSPSSSDRLGSVFEWAARRRIESRMKSSAK